jgi:hypothetical protein
VQEQFVAMFLEEWRDSDEYERRQEEIEMTNMDPEDYEEPVAGPASWSQVGSPCYSPPPPDDGGDPYGGYSADMFYDRPGDSGDECTSQPHEGPRVCVQLRVRYGRSVEVKLRLPKIDYENDYEQMCERELERQERIALITGRPWHEAREGAVLPWHWTEDLGRDLSASVPPPGRGGCTDEPKERWRASQLTGSRLPASAHAPGIRDIVIVYQTIGQKTDHKQLGRN